MHRSIFQIPLCFCLTACCLALAAKGQDVEVEEFPIAEEPAADEAAGGLQEVVGGVLDAVIEVFKVRVAPVAAPMAPQVNEDQIKQIAQQYVQRLRPRLTTELALIRHNCNVPEKERPAIKAAGVEELERVAKDFAQMQFQPNRQQARVNLNQRDLGKSIREALTKPLRDVVTAEEFARYTKALDERAVARKQASIDWLVAHLDATLYLTPQQREQIAASIAAKWQEQWEGWLMMHQYGGQYFPNVPDDLVAPHLNEDQKSVWSGLTKIEVNAWNMGQEAIAGDDDWWGDDPAKAKEDANVEGAVEVIIQ